MPKRMTYRDLRVEVMRAGANLTDVERQVGITPSTLSRMVKADPNGIASPEFRDRLLAAIEREK
jgi:DNA-binding LacI/PurR family transcriptional regulator